MSSPHCQVSCASMHCHKAHNLSIYSRPVGRGGSRGFTRTLQKILYHCLTVHFKCPTVWNWSTSFDAIENRPNKSGCRYASLFLEDQCGTRARKLFTPLRWKDARINMCVNKSYISGAREFTSAYVDSQKLDVILHEPCSYYGSASVWNWSQKQSQSI